MKTQAARLRRYRSFGAVLLSLVALLALAPTAEATRTLPVAVTTALEPGPPAAPALDLLSEPEIPGQTFGLFSGDDLSLFAALSLLDATEIERLSGENRFRLFSDSGEISRRVERVWSRKTALPASTSPQGCNVLAPRELAHICVDLFFQGAWTDPITGIAYHRNRWYDPRTANWLSEDPLGAVDSPNLYAFVGWGPHMYSDPMGLHTYRTKAINGVEYTILGPDPEEIEQGQYGMSISYTPAGRDKRVSISISQHEGEMIALQAKLGNPLVAQAFELFYGTSVDEIPDSIIELEGRGAWHHKVDMAVATLAGFVMAGGRPQPPSSNGSGAPRINLANPKPSKPISEIPEAWQGGRRVYRIPPGASGGETAYSRVSPAVRQRFFPGQGPRPSCSYCRTRPARPVDHVDPKSRGGNLTPENTTPACSHCNSSKGARPAPKTPPGEYTGAWPPEWWPEHMKTWWQGTYGANPS